MTTIPDINTRFARPIVCPVNGDVVSAETLYNRCCAAMGHVVCNHIGDLILDNLAYGEGYSHERDGGEALCAAVYAWSDNVRKLIAETPAPTIKRRLICQSNGVICLETRQPGLISTGIARDLVFHIEWFSNKGWIKLGEFVDPITARSEFAAQRKRNTTIRWRLTANNEHGSVKLPNNWRGGYGS